MQKIDIPQHVSQFTQWLESDKKQGPEWMDGWEEERQKRRNWYKEKLSPDKIDSLTEDDFGKLVKDLWATQIWNNKEYKVKKVTV